MGLLPTLNTTKFTTAKLGAPATQPAKNSVDATTKAQSTQSTGTSVRGVAPASESAILNVVGLSFDAGQLLRLTNPSLKTLVSKVISDKNFILPAFAGKFTKIQPTYLSHLKPRVIHRPDSTDDFAVATRKFEPYEQLTGISQERPEIVMMLPFVPLFSDEVGHSNPPFLDLVESSGVNPYMTDAGWYADTQLQARNLRAINVIADLRRLRDKNFTLKNIYAARKREFEKNLDTLQNITQFLLDLVKKSDILKNQLDLRDDIFLVRPDPVARTFASQFPIARSSFLTNILVEVAKQFLPPSYTIPDALIRLGYSAENSKTLYSSTKIWLQLLLEYKHILENHSLEFLDIQPVAQKSDNNATTITSSDANLFGLTADDPAGIGPINEVVKVQPSELTTFLASLDKAFQGIYDKGAQFKTEEARISALANLLSKEHKYSKGLADDTVRRALAEYYSYGTNDTSAGNLQLFDSVIGRFGQNVFEFPEVDKNSLASLAQQQPAANVAVLTFESKYLDGDNGSLTPGSAFYVDPVFRTDGKTFNSSTLTTLGQLMRDSHRNFSVIINGMNLLSTVDSDPQNQNKNSVATYIDNPSAMIKYVLKNILDTKGNTLASIKNDRLGSLYVLAAQDVKVRSIMFHYTLNRMFRVHFTGGPTTPNVLALNADNVATSDALISRLLTALLNSTKESTAALQQLSSQHLLTDANDLDDDAIKNALKQGTIMSGTVETLMLQIFSAVQEAILTSTGRMRFSGQYNTVIMMVAFDMLISMIARYSNQRIVTRRSGGKSGNRKTTYTVAKTSINHKNSTNDITTRLDREQTFTQQLTYCVLNVLQKLGNAVDGFNNYINAPTAKNNLQSISKIIDDPNLLQMLMSEQQIMLLGSTVFDMIGKFKQATTSNPNVDIDRDGDFDSDDEIKLLDDSLITPKIRNALFGMFSSPEFVGTRAYNKKILTVGIPLGFTRKLKQLVAQQELKKTSFVTKQHDIIQVVVYKVDLVNQDIIYQPVRFLFEMSRFPVRNDVYYRTLGQNPSFEDITNAVPTRDWEESFEEGQDAVSYWSSKLQGSHDSRNAMDSASYEFLSVDQKSEIIRNHLISFFSEIYIKLTAGINVGEYAFDLVDRPRSVEEEFVKLIADHRIQEVANFVSVKPKNVIKSPLSRTVTSTGNTAPTGGVLFSTTTRQTLPHVNSLTMHSTQTQPRTTSASGLAGKISSAAMAKSIQNPPITTSTKAATRTVLTTANALDKLSSRQIPQLLHSLKTLSSFTKMQTSIADGLAVSKQLLNPKQFDRVFNVIVDPDEFKIDINKTTATKFGKQALEQMIRRGEIVPADLTPTEERLRKFITSTTVLTRLLSRPVAPGRPDPNLNSFKFRDRDRSEGDLMFEKYFITIETFGEEDV